MFFIGSLVACMLIYILMSIVDLIAICSPNVPVGSGSGRRLSARNGPVRLDDQDGGSSADPVIRVMYGRPGFYTMARDGLLPGFRARPYEFRTPWINTLVVGLREAIARGVF